MSSSKTLFGRRTLVRGAAATALATALPAPALARGYPAPEGMPEVLPDVLQGPPAIRAPRGTERFWREVARAFPLPRRYIHMNTGTTGSQPSFSLANLAVYDLYKSLDPRDWQANLERDYPDRFRSMAERQAEIASLFNALPEEIVLSYNTTDACNLVFAGTPWQPGDRIITTTFEHPALNGPIAWARDYMGVDVVMIEIPTDWTAAITIGDVVGWFEAELAKPLPPGAKQYVAFSEIFYKNGVRMPVREIVDAARAWGAYSIVDNAHGWGMIPVDCHAYGADFIAGAGHKWLCGGPGTGIFYVRNQGGQLPPFNMGNWFLYGNPFTAPSANYGVRTWRPSASMQSRGETNTPALYAMTDSAAFFAQVGLGDVYERGVALAAHLQQKVKARWGAAALSVDPGEAAFRTFLTAFNPFRAKNDPSKYAVMNAALGRVVTALAASDPKIYIRTITWRVARTDQADSRTALRISTHAMYNDREQIDWMFDRVTELVDAETAANPGELAQL